ncbi:MAG: PhoX family protein [Lachnospiraceae bacterium]|nr:PhoX family protein [Lachnospiraceae bacterium]
MGADGVTLYAEKLNDEGTLQWVKIEEFCRDN